MFKILFTIFLSFTFSQIFAQAPPADRILGEWMSEEKDSRIEIYKVGSEYFGKLLWSQDLFESDGITSRKDIRNTDKNLRNRNLLDVNLLHDFVYEEGIWDDGKMYDAKSGKTYNCVIKLRDQILEIRSYIGIPLFGRSTYWEKSLKGAL